jgi:SAM-dependent methyltransferase
VSALTSPPQALARGAVTGAAYEAQLSARRSDRRTRAAFRELALRLVAPGDTLLDFGCGTGMDARFYAGHGLRVHAYDVDPDMCDYFETSCRKEIDAGRVTLLRGSYDSFLGREGRPLAQIELVTANFAPLNLLESLAGLFAALHVMTAPGARVLASVLSPYFVGDLRYRWWWRNLPALMREGRYCVAGVHRPIVRRRLTDLAAEAHPYFALQRVYRGSLSSAQPARGAEWHGHGAWLPLATCRYMFLLFTRLDDAEPTH